ncbi:MAG: bifunctional diaminohydroxyphosphoribosylaminopyrimidine deaminase/5-amino-6-(5-phosphoribosylamino)uracil reductase RibD [Actinomycetota bacterium]
MQGHGQEDAKEDARHMRRAIELAQLGRGLVSPNPMVGAVVVRGDEIVGEGWYEGPRGRPHAEVLALQHAGDRARGATLYCTLEPCDHHGSTPPCTELVISSGVSRVVVAAGDPNPIVDGRGLVRLRAAGIELLEGILAGDAHRLNEAFERHVTTGLPFVTWKSAASLDGRTAAHDRSAKWITGEAARDDAQRLRAAADAIVVGAGTAIADDPSLTVRLPGYAGRPPLRVLVDASGRTPADARIFDDRAPTIVATGPRVDRKSVDAWTAAGADVEVFEEEDSGGVSLPELLANLGKRDVQGLLVEGGATLAWSFVRERLVDRVVLYLAPKLVGGALAPGVLMGDGFAPIGNALALEIVSVDRIGDDVRVEADVHRDH